MMETSEKIMNRVVSKKIKEEQVGNDARMHNQAN